MKNLIKHILVLFFIIFFSANSYASDFSIVNKKTITIGNFKVGIGSTVDLLTDRKSLSGEQIFLGNVLKADGSELYKMMFSVKEKKVYYIDSQYFSNNIDQQTVIDPYIQVGSTCTGYAINGFLHQTNLANVLNLDTLKEELMTEEGRSQLLAHAINEYYLTPAHRYSIRGILDGYGKKYGFKCKMLKTDSFDKAKDFILKHLKTGLPVVVSFNIGR